MIHINGNILSDNYEIFFRECILHSRHNKAIKELLKEIFEKRNTFKNINTFEEMYLLCKKLYGSIKRVGPLCIYDITTQLCKYNNIIIDKIYLASNTTGPYVFAMKHKMKLHRCSKLLLYYINCQDVIDIYGIDYIEKFTGKLNIFIGDQLETFCCYIQ
jgi:hypothetical protein